MELSVGNAEESTRRRSKQMSAPSRKVQPYYSTCMYGCMSYCKVY